MAEKKEERNEELGYSAEEKLINRINSDFRYALNYWNNWRKEAELDCEAALGEQWERDSKEILRKRGVKALTINKIKPNLQLLEGLEAQNRTDFAVYPVGIEDEIKGEIATRLLKTVMNNADGERKVSDNFANVLISGVSYLEPYIDYSRDLINGDMKFRVVSGFNVFIDPASIEYNLNDAKFVCKLTVGLTKDEVKNLYPNKHNEIDDCGRCNIDLTEFGATTEHHNDPYNDYDNPDSAEEFRKGKSCDLIEYHYKKRVTRYCLADRKAGTVEDFDTLPEAEKAKAERATVDEFGNITASAAVIIERKVEEIWTAVLLGGNILLYDGRAWTYPKWAGYPLIPEFAFRYSSKLTKDNKSELMIQGIVRAVRDLNFELNKRRTQELHLLNTSANSGWMFEEGSLVKPNVLSEYGSSPGVNIEIKRGHAQPKKIIPTPLSQGHAQLAAEAAQDMKEITGINTDLLAQNENQASGRAIALRQRQGMVMVQKLFDNHSYSKKLLGKFILTHLGELFDIFTAIKALGAGFMRETFGDTPEGVKNGYQTIADVLDDTKDFTKYDVVVGESAISDTVKIGNYLMLMDLRQQGVPVDPAILIEQTLLPSATKTQLQKAMSAAMQPLPPQQAVPAAGVQPPNALPEQSI